MTKTVITALAAGILCSTQVFATEPESVVDSPPEGVELLLPRGGIPALFEPEFIPASEADIPDSAWILGIAIGYESHAYSLNLLNHHEIVNDTIGGRPLAAVW